MKPAPSTPLRRLLSVLAALALCATTALGITDAAKFKFKKGINVSRLESWTDTTAGYLGEDSTYTEIKSKGFDHVRFPVYFKNYYDSGSQTLKSNISVIDGVLDKCEANGLYVFLDFHGWSSINTTNGTDRADFLKIWDLVADRYRNRSDYVIFELINEPHTTEGGNLDAANLNALQAEVLPIIRRTNPDRLVLLAAAEWNGPWKLSELTIPDNPGPIGVVCHTYGPLAFTHQGATWGGFSTDHVAFTSADKTATGTKDLDDAFRYIDDFQEKTGVPVVMNEFGVNKQNSKATDAETLDWTSYVARNCESNGIAWTWWEYNKGFGAYYQSSWWSGYQWRAPVMDGLFPAEPAGNAYSDSFDAAEYANTLTISFTGYAGSSALTDFPALVKLSTAIPGFDYADFRRTGGDDLRFTDANGNLLPHEIDTWNSNGVSTVWVKVPSLTAATKIRAHYGCSLPVAVDSSAVWDSDYVGVWHLGESGLPLHESSRSSTDFTKQNGSGIQYAAAGVVGGSVDFGATGNGRMITAQDCDALDGFTACTVEAWTYQTSNTTAAVLSKRYAYNKNLSYFLYHNGTKTQFNVAASDTTSGSSAQLAPPLNQWTHQVYTFDAGTIRGYMNGAKAGTDKTLSFSKINASNGYLHLGNFCRDGAWNADTRNFPGKIDEVRISKCVRSADWLQATHDTVENASFATYAVDGAEPPPATDLADLALKARTDKDNPIDYAVGETIRFDFFLDGVERLPPEAAEPLYAIWTRTGDDGIQVVGTNAISLAQGFSVDTSLAVPGIERIRATLVGPDYSPVRSASVASVAFDGGAGAETEKMLLSTVEPADFDAFWAEAKAKLATVPFDDASVELVDVTPASAANSFTIYAAKIPCYGPRPVTGWLAIPKTVPAGGLPVQANFDGYGCATAAPKVPTWGVSGQIRFTVNAHGYDLVGHDDQYYQDFNDSINKTNRTFGGTTYSYGLAPQDYDDPSDTYFYYMALRVVRAFEYLKSRPEWNGRDVIAEGGSQGGLQTMWAGGLVDGITKIRPAITWGCDVGCPFNGKGTFPSRTWGIPCVPGASYFDAALHAKRVPRDCVAQLTRLGMGDYTCPPRGVLLSYYNMPCAVSATLVQGSTHGYVPPAPNQTYTISKEAVSLPAIALSAAAEPGFAWTNGTATVSVAVTNGVAVPVGAVVRMTVSDASGAVLGTAGRAWMGDGDYAFDTADAVSGTALSGYDYTLSFAVVDGSGAPVSGDAAACGLRLGSAASWFSADPATGEVAGGAWEAVPNVSEGTWTISDGAAFAAFENRTGLVRCDVELPVSTTASSSDLPSALAFAAANGERAGLAPVDDGGDIVWHGLVLENGALAWKELQGGGGLQSAVPFIPIAMELDLADPSAPRVSYLVGGERLRDASGAAWFPAPGTAAAAEGVVDIHGSGSVGAFSGSVIDKAVAETADGTRHATLAEALAAGDVTLLTNVEWPEGAPVGTTAIDRDGHVLLQGGVAVEGSSVVVTAGPVAIAGEGTLRVTFGKLASAGVATAGRTPAQIAADLAAAGANGIPRWQSLVLGLDAADPDALPLADIAVDSASGTVSVSDAGLAVDESTGATVTYQVREIPDLADPSADIPVGDPAAPGEPVALPMGAAAARFFRIQVRIALP